MKKVILYLICLLPNVLLAQDANTWKKIQEIQNPQQQLEFILENGRELIGENPEVLPKLIALTRQLAHQLNHPYAMLTALNYEALYLQTRGKLDSAMLIHRQVLESARSKPYPKLLVETYNHIGSIYNLQSKLESHITYLDSALIIAKQNKLELLVNRCLMNRSYIVFHIGKEQEAILTMWEALKGFKKLKALNDLSVGYNNLGIFYRLNGKSDSAQMCCLEAERYAKEANSPLYLADAWCELGYIAESQKNYAIALNYVNRADSIFKLRKDIKGRYRIFTFTIQMHMNNKEYTKAQSVATDMLQLGLHVNNIKWIAEAYLFRAEAAEKSGSYSSALAFLKKHMSYQDSFDAYSANEKLAEMEFRNQTREKDRELEVLRLDNALKKQNLKWAYTLVVASVLVLVAISLSVYVFYRNKKLKQQQDRAALLYQIEKQQSELELKTRQLTSKALFVSENQQTVQEIRELIQSLNVTKEYRTQLETLDRKLQQQTSADRYWSEFKTYFEELNPDFFDRIKVQYPDITDRELRLMAFIKIGLNTKEIATLMHIEPASVKTARYRLKKKLGMSPDLSFLSLEE